MQALIGEEDRLQRPVMMAVMIEIEEGGVFLAMNHQGTEMAEGGMEDFQEIEMVVEEGMEIGIDILEIEKLQKRDHVLLWHQDQNPLKILKEVRHSRVYLVVLSLSIQLKKRKKLKTSYRK